MVATPTSDPMMRPVAAVSVVIPVFRASKLVVAAIESVARQTVLPREVIVVDDASGDDTTSAVAALQALYPDQWLKLVCLTENRGAGEARNAGWNIAQGEWLAFLDADDTWKSNKLELQLMALQCRPEIVLCGHAFCFSWDSDANSVSDDPVSVQDVSAADVLWRNPFITPSVMVRRDVPLRFHAGQRYMEDHLLWMEIVLNGYPTCKLDANLAVIGKPQFGSGGLSGNLWAMEKAELKNYQYLHASGHIGFSALVFFWSYSLLKYVRRLLLVGIRRIIG